MKIGIHKGFLDSLDALSKDDRKRTRETLGKLEQDSAAPGLRWHSVMHGFTSLSVTMSIRVIARRSADQLLLLYVDQHDEAYKWAERHAVSGEDESGILELITLGGHGNERVAETVLETYGKTLKHLLLESHVPLSVAAAFEDCSDEAELLVRAEAMSPEWQEVVLRVATGESLSLEDVPTGSSFIRVVSSDRELERAIALPFSTWRHFLHPSQRAVVENTSDRYVAVLGGPGTGKTVVCAYRACFLSGCLKNSDGGISVLLTVAIDLVEDLRHIVDVISRSGDSFHGGIAPGLPAVYSLDTLAGGKSGAPLIAIADGSVVIGKQGMLRRVDAITIDEFQDCPVWFIEFLRRAVIETSCRFITIALDAHQTIFGSSASSEIATILQEAQKVFLGYSYRMTRQLLEHSFSALSRYAPEYMSPLALNQGIRYPLTTLSGPPVRYARAVDTDSLLVETRKAIRQLEEKYDGGDGLALIYLQYFATHFHQRKKVDPLVSAITSDPLMAKYYKFGFWAKGKEYAAGVVVIPASFFRQNLGEDAVLRLNTMFVCLTRFRQELIVVYHRDAPAAKYLPID